MPCVDPPSGWSRIAVTCALLVGACSEEEGLSRPTPSVHSAQGNEDADASAAWTRAPDEICDAREKENLEWVKGYLGCEHDADCEITKTEAGCLAPLLCPVSLSTNIDRPTFEREALKRQAAYKPECGCAIARCAAFDQEAYCDPATKRCSQRRKQAAGSPAATELAQPEMSSSARSDLPVQLNIAAHETAVAVESGREIEITLSSIGSGGYGEPTVSSDAVRFLESIYPPLQNPGGPTLLYRFVAVEPGTARIVIGFSDPRNGDAGARKAPFHLTIDVK